jgi:acyl-CoA synthetase (AMP-forming)/AMP-acid ligase II
VEDVVVIGLPDEDWGHRVHAVVQVSQSNAPTAAELGALCRDGLSPYKIPKAFEFVHRLPRDESGKIRRSQVRAERLPGISPSEHQAGTSAGQSSVSLSRRAPLLSPRVGSVLTVACW